MALSPRAALIRAAAARLRVGVVPVWLLLAVGVVLALTTLDVANHGMLTVIDHAVSRRMTHWDLRHRRWSLSLIYPLTLFGQRGTVLAVTIPTVAYLVWRSRSTDPGVRYLLALASLAGAVYAVKDLLHRTAPPTDLLHTAAGASYPSGHVANAVLVWATVWYSARAIDPDWVLTRALDLVRRVGPVAVMIGMTLLDYHWVSDFIAGACIATILLALVTHPAWRRWSRYLDRQIWRSVRPAH